MNLPALVINELDNNPMVSIANAENPKPNPPSQQSQTLITSATIYDMDNNLIIEDVQSEQISEPNLSMQQANTAISSAATIELEKTLMLHPNSSNQNLTGKLAGSLFAFPLLIIFTSHAYTIIICLTQVQHA